MQTLGLSSAPQPTDNLFKRLFWPTIENGYDVDLVGQQGFWVCTLVAVISTAITLVAGHAAVGLLIGATYFLGGFGVRQRSVAAAILVFACYLLDRVVSVEALVLGMPGGGNPLEGIIATMLLFANVRATLLARRWKNSTPGDVSEMPERTTTTLGDKLANIMPEKLWPIAKYVFFPLAGVLVVLSLLSMVGLPVMKAKMLSAAPSDSTTIQVDAPPR